MTLFRAVLLATLLATPGLLPAQSTPLPDTPVGRAVNTFLTRYNRGRELEPRFARWFALYGPVEPRVVTLHAADRLTVWSRGTLTHAWIAFDATQPSGSAPLEIVVLTLGGAGPVDSTHPAPRASVASLPSRLAAYLEALSVADYFSGVVLVARRGTPIFSRAFGRASQEYQVPNRMDTPFMLGSVTKMFTGTAILQLAQGGKLSLNDSLKRFLPEYPIAAVRNVTVHQLLTHTAGLGRASVDWITDRTPRTLEQLVQLTAVPPAFPAGTDVSYNNEAWLLLGRIIEIASGKPYEQYVGQEVFARAGMRQSGWHDTGEIIPFAATPYTNSTLTADGRGWLPVRRAAWLFANGRGSPAGDSWASAADLLAFASALQSGQLLDSTHFHLMTSSQTPNRPLPGVDLRNSFGYGMEINESGGRRRVGKSGGTAGVSTQFAIFPEAGYVVIVLSNYDSIANLVMTGISEMLPR